MKETKREAVERILKEFSKGCSCAGAYALSISPKMPKNPSECEECFQGAVTAIMSLDDGSR